MPVTSDIWSRVVTAPTREHKHNILIQNEKTLLCCFAITCMKTRNEQDFIFENRDKFAGAARQ